MIALNGVRCTVRSWRRSDAQSLVTHADNINVAKHLRDRFPHPYTREDARAFLKHAATDDPTNLAIEVAGAAVGAIGYVPGRDVERFSAEVGYWLGESLWGRGIVTEALGLLTEHAFAKTNVLRMFALPFADNAGSARVLEKAGYTREGLLRSSSVKYGVIKDQLLFARINPAWTDGS
ncbi:MAG: GNAT family N-acetyltransferase [Acidobacteriota bacterium]|nr:GNAT family N-acetyltransferase [Acidobacteriota bacterium]MDQ3419963.1 GNAT family N-acetyltransferase [Acidobacteriota bacterium]